MSVYAVGDIQGCYHELMELLERVNFSTKTDRLWVVGDLVNRGPDSKAALKFLYENRRAVVTVLGNHDLHLLAVYCGSRKARSSDTFDAILNAKGCDDWMHWLSKQPLCHYDEKLDYCMVHAGIAPQWTLKQALSYSAEIETVLQGKSATQFLEAMYGNDPDCWNNDLQGMERLRCITNYFTRMRLVSHSGSMELSYKGAAHFAPEGYYPWFEHPERKTAFQRVIFGHWAALGGHIDAFSFGLDTGCVWGRHLTLMNLDTQELHIAQAIKNKAKK